jgi:hypothetical protein
MEICAGRHVVAPNVWTRAVEVYDATIRLGDAQPAAATLASVVARIDAALPHRRGLFGAFTPTDTSDAEAPGTDPPRLLGQIALTLQTEARPGQVVIGGSTRARLPPHAAVEALGPLVLKGRQEPVAAFRLCSLGS